MTRALFTIGYEGRSIGEYVALLRRHQIAVVVDVRETARSRKPGFSLRALGAALAGAGVEYLHAPFAGNPRWLRAEGESAGERLELYSWYLDAHPEVLQEFDHLINRLLCPRRRVCITCFERRASECHRSILGNCWARLGARSVVDIGAG